MNKRKNILSDIEKNYADTKSISKTVDITSLENGVNPHTIYKDVFKKVDNDTPNDFPTEKISVGDIVYTDNNPNKQFEVITINNKNNIIIKDLSTNEVIETDENNIKKIMENIDMAKKKINETQYSVSINGLETTDANALSQMMSAAAQADSGNADVGGMDMTSTPELPTPEKGAMDPAVNEPITSVESIPPAEDSVETFDEEPSFEDSDIEGMDDELPTDVENPLDNPEPEMDSFEDDFKPVVDDIEFDEEITPTEDELDESIAYASKKDLSDIILKNPTRKELKDNNLIQCRCMEDGEGNWYFADMENMLHCYMEHSLRDEAYFPYYDGNDSYGISYYDAGTNEFWYNPNEMMTKQECINQYKNSEYFRTTFPNARVIQNPWGDQGVDDLYDDEDEQLDEPVENDLGINESKLNESRPDKEDFININTQNVDENVLQELYEIICEQMGDDYLSDYDEVDHMELLDCVKDFGNDIEGFDEEFAEEYANALQEKWKEEHIDDGSDYEDYARPNWEDEEDEEINEDILLPKATEDETFVAKKKLENDKEEDEESERISESMDALIKSILESADAKSEQEIYAEEISEEKDDSKCCPKCGKEKCVCKDEEILDEDNDEFDVEISEALRNAGVQLDEEKEYPGLGLYKEFNDMPSSFWKHEFESASKSKDFNREWVEYCRHKYEEAVKKEKSGKLDEATVKPTIVTDESSFANKPNKALKPEDKKTVKKKTVDTATFGKDASEGFKEPLNCIKCEAVSPKEKIKAIYETAKTRYANADKSQWNALDRRYIRKLIESGCGYTRASKIILEAKKKK